MEMQGIVRLILVTTAFKGMTPFLNVPLTRMFIEKINPAMFSKNFKFLRFSNISSVHRFWMQVKKCVH